MRTWILAVFTAAALAGCASVQRPVGVGGGTDDLPLSPCACDEPFYENGEWLG